MTETFTFEIPGPPVAKERPRRAGDGHWYTPKRTTAYEEAVAWAAKAAGVHLEPKTPYAVTIDLYLSTHQRDLDNMAKSILDGLKRMGDDWDDRQVQSLVVRSHSVKDAAEECARVEIGARPCLT